MNRASAPRTPICRVSSSNSALLAFRSISMIRAVPPGFSTRCISASAFSGSRKFLKAAVQMMKSTVPSASGIAATLPSWKSTSTPASAALRRAIATKSRLMSSPVMR